MFLNCPSLLKRVGSKNIWHFFFDYLKIIPVGAFFIQTLFSIGKNNNIRAVQAESSKFATLLFDQGVQIVINPSAVFYVPEPIGTPSDSILHQSDCCLLCQWSTYFAFYNVALRLSQLALSPLVNHCCCPYSQLAELSYLVAAAAVASAAVASAAGAVGSWVFWGPQGSKYSRRRGTQLSSAQVAG